MNANQYFSSFPDDYTFQKAIPVHIDPDGNVTREPLSEEEFRELIRCSPPRVLDVWKYAPSTFPHNAGDTTR